MATASELSAKAAEFVPQGVTKLQVGEMTMEEWLQTEERGEWLAEQEEMARIWEEEISKDMEAWEAEMEAELDLLRKELEETERDVVESHEAEYELAQLERAMEEEKPATPPAPLRCKFGPTCKFMLQGKCRSWHPKSEIPCRFGAKCRGFQASAEQGCEYKHVLEVEEKRKKIKCRFGAGCRYKEKCHFSHD